MTAIAYSKQAMDDLTRLADFLFDQDPVVAFKTAKIMTQAVDILQNHPEIGQRVHKQYRKLIISRGPSGYLALYHYHPVTDLVTIVAVRHQRESGYKSN